VCIDVLLSRVSAVGPTCRDNADWCPGLFAGQCYDRSVERVCCATCSRHRTSQQRELCGPLSLYQAALRIALSLFERPSGPSCVTLWRNRGKSTQ